MDLVNLHTYAHDVLDEVRVALDDPSAEALRTAEASGGRLVLVVDSSQCVSLAVTYPDGRTETLIFDLSTVEGTVHAVAGLDEAEQRVRATYEILKAACARLDIDIGLDDRVVEREAGRLLGLAPDTLRKAALTGTSAVAFVRSGNHRRYSLLALSRYLEGMRDTPAHDASDVSERCGKDGIAHSLDVRDDLAHT